MSKKNTLIGIALTTILSLSVCVAHADTDSLFLDTNGNVGIGTTQPGTRLHIQGDCWAGGDQGTARGFIAHGVDGGYFQVKYGTAWNTRIKALGVKKAGWQYYDGQWQDGLTLSNGNIGIGTQDPQYNLDITGHLRVSENIILDAGKVITSPGRMHISGEELLYVLNKDGVIIGKEFGGTGDLTVQGLINGVVVGNSDLRWKENIEPIQNALDIIADLRGVTYTWTDASRGNGVQIGVIAQEVEQVLPEVVHTDSQGYKSVEYAKLVVPLIEAVKALKSQNVELQSENMALKQENEDIRQALAKILSRLDALEKQAR